MATARKCDRCGNYYDLNDFHPYLKDGKTYKLAQIYIFTNNRLNAVIYDLCPECMEKLMAFLDDSDRSKCCRNCKYYSTPASCDPCISCVDQSRWHEKNADDSEKEEE